MTGIGKFLISEKNHAPVSGSRERVFAQIFVGAESRSRKIIGLEHPFDKLGSTRRFVEFISKYRSVGSFDGFAVDIDFSTSAEAGPVDDTEGQFCL